MFYLSGCTDSLAINYNAEALMDDGSCLYPLNGCTDSLACNYDTTATIDNGSCEYALFWYEDLDGNGLGCPDWGPIISCDSVTSHVTNNNDFSCLGCIDSLALNFDSTAQYSNSSCIYLGCTDSSANNYNPNASIDDGSCSYCITGCTDSLAINYNAVADCDDGSCLYPLMVVRIHLPVIIIL